MLISINPANDEIINEYKEHTENEIISIIEKSDLAFQDWRLTSFKYRSELMIKAAAVLRKNKKEYAELMTIEMGKPIQQSYSEIEKCAWVCDFYAEKAELFLADEIVTTDASKSFITYNPLGVILAVMPWNFPFWQVFRFAAPALMAGNGGILKHSSNVTGCALAIENVFREAGFPENLFRTLLISSKHVEKVINDPGIKAVTLTGSTPAGKAVASAAGKALKKSVLELGGSDPYVILEDADLDSAADICAVSRLINGGQSCIAAKRFIVVEKVYDEFIEKFIKKMSVMKMGNPFDENNDIGPQARTDLRDELHHQVIESVSKGAQLVLGGTIPEEKGAYYPPSILVNVTKGMPAYDDELFGPVAAVIKARNEDDAVYIANDSIFGLGAAVFTKNISKGEIIAKSKINAGACFVNSFVKSDPRLPFGGIKESGYGRELSYFGIREFVNIKSVYIN